MASKLLSIFLSLNQSHRLLLSVIIVIAVSLQASAQTPIKITSITIGSKTATRTVYQASAPSDADNVSLDFVQGEVSYGIRNGGVGFENDTVTSYTLDGYVDPFDFFLAPDTVAIRRTDGSRFINIWYELHELQNNSPSLDSIVMQPESVEDADLIYRNNNINSGYDNILVNTDDEGNNLIQAQTERVDIIWYNGIVTCNTDNAVFPVVERGGNDEIKVAAITSLDANGDPDEYSTLLSINGDEDGPSFNDWPQAGQSYNNFMILRRQNFGEDPLPLLNIGTFRGQSAQTVQGVAFSFTDFGISPGQVVYGYSLFASDVNESYDLTNFSSFPNNTLSSTSGLDLVAGLTAAVSNDDCLTPATGPGGYKAALSTWLKANGVNASSGVKDVSDSDIQDDPVTDWQDHWVGNHDFTTDQGTPSYNLSSSLINFNPSVEFAGASLTTSNNEDFNSASSYSKKGINLVFRTPGTLSGTQVLYEQGNADRGLNIYLSGSTLRVGAWNRSGTTWNTGTPINDISVSGLATDTEYIVTLELNGNGSNTGTARAYLQGEQFGTLSNVGLLQDHSAGDITLGSSETGESSQYSGGSASGAFSFEGEIPEFIYCNEPGSFLQAQRRRIESYLAIKYGITLDQDPSAINYLNSKGEIIFNTTLSTALGGYRTYNKDIAGIGRDDASELSQLQSKSENSGSIVTMGRDTEFPKDNTFLIWGNDGANFEDNTTTNLPTNIGRRVDRVWRVGETGSAGLVDVSFDLTGTTFTGSNYSLLIAGNSSAGNFSSAQIITGGVLDGNTLTFSNVDFSNGQFFTLGTTFSTDCGPGGENSNMGLWLKADLGPNTITNNASISSWADLSGAGNDATQGTESAQPALLTNYLNFNPVVHFDEFNDEMLGTGGFSTQAFYMVLIPDADINSGTSVQAPIGFGNTTAAGSFVLGDGSNAIFGDGSQDDLVSLYVENGSGQYYAHNNDNSRTLSEEVPINHTIIGSGSSYEIYENGLNLSVTAGVLGFDGSTYRETTFPEAYRIGATFGGIANFDGKIAEVVSYSSPPDATQNIKIQSYFSIKYGITHSNDQDGDATPGETITGSITEGDLLASDEGIIWDYSENSDYHHNVAGIGRDDNSCLEQKQSKSVNSSSIVTMGIGGISTSNATNENSFPADDSFLIWGSDGTDPDDTPVTTQLPGTVTERMATIWRVQETGTVGDVSISFNLTDLSNFPIGKASDYQLIIAPSGSTMPDFSSAATYSGATINGNVITFDNVDFSDGDYFTLGTARSDCAPGGVSTDLALWLRADVGTDGTTDGSFVTNWADQSTSGFDVTSISNLGGGNPANPTYEVDEINFNPAIRFYDPSSTNSAFMETTGSHSVTGNLSMVVVFKSGQAQGTTNDFQNSPVFISTNAAPSNTADYGMGMANGRLYANAANNNTFNVHSPSTPLYNTLEPFIATTTRLQAATAGSINLYANSANVATGTSTNTALNARSTFGIGNHPDTDVDAQLSARIGEVIVFSDELEGSERQRVESYLAIKYGITRDVAAFATASEQDYLASDGSTIFFDWDENATYRSDIAGVGRDDGSCLTQTKSKSENNDAIVTMQVSSFGNDNSFMMWANDNAVMEDANNREYNRAQVRSRLNREWRIQETGTVSTATITFDLASITGPTGIGTNNLNQVVMMVDADGDFRSGVTLIEPTSINAVNKTVTFKYNFTDGQFFTLGSTEVAALPIDLIAFSATALQNQVFLSWTTASEENNAYFSIERSSDGESFSVIGELDGAGISNSVLNYRYTDRQPLEGRSYYRLKQVDFNGNFSYSPVEGVLIRSKVEQRLDIHPNPISKNGTLTLEYSLPAQPGYNSTNNIIIYDLKGRVMFNQSVSSTSTSTSIELNGYAEGIYLVVLESSDGTRLSKRLVISQ